MKAFFAFYKKELCEAARTHKLTVMGLVFLLFGIMSPLAAKFMPDIVSSAMPEGMVIALPEPVAADSWAQFFKNISQIGLIVMVILFGATLTGEISRGTLAQLLTKGLSRRAVIFAKFASAGLIWTAAYALAFLVTLAYTLYFWQGETVSGLLFAVCGLWLFGMLLISALLLGGALFRASYAGLLFVGGLVIALFLLNLIPALRDYNPVALAGGTILTVSDFFPLCAVAALLAASLLAGAIGAFNKKIL
jgi:ABC-2 type transport system permease protein